MLDRNRDIGDVGPAVLDCRDGPVVVAVDCCVPAVPPVGRSGEPVRLSCIPRPRTSRAAVTSPAITVVFLVIRHCHPPQQPVRP
ncbi:Uncharacterised protein [Propionibacterium australiense]|uniref:Uncharacterized protein n=1 Tax=Propionibacterium australiense TaxID=119981 RepID=A0A383S7K8_9ACTN|nr:hypothetical protein D9T14_07050 [Propionibacterium australiense]RLP09911.1 hypothetical protein D7U36_06985 [Propionibacterium australiense]SYZ33823.1 Hypothetical protein PROPAUS_1776 [Propionibacterium australiense]VEH91963.1 Uncharacterised protein [Propionibacterium australiense]